MNKNKYYILIGILIILLFIFYPIESSFEKKNELEVDAILNISSLSKLIFSLPNMDKEMCETFPRVIISVIENTNGVLDASFNYDGHVMTIYYDDGVLDPKELLNNSAYEWIGVEFISNEKVDISLVSEIYKEKEKNNQISMPVGHMNDIAINENNELINLQNFSSLVSSEWLKENINNVKIIEIGPSVDYLLGHVENSVNIGISDIRRNEDGVIKQVLLKEDFEKLIGNLGINENDRVVIYSSKSLIHASRLYWTFKYYGHKNVAIVDGGKDNIKKTFDLVKGSADVSIKNYFSSIKTGIRVDSNYILENKENLDFILLDVRSKDEFNAGHIENAINIDWTELINSDGTLKNLDSLENILRSIDKNKEIIIYCESGTRASYAWFILSEVLEFPNVKLYDGSMIEWRYKKLYIELN